VTLVIPELDMLYAFGKAARHHRYAIPHVNVERLAQAGTTVDLPNTYHEALDQTFRRFELSEFERRLARIYFDASEQQQPIGVRMVIADILCSMERPSSRVRSQTWDENRSSVVLTFGQVLRTLAVELSASPDPVLSEIGSSITYALP
jgi:hypothetical protein